MSVFDIFAKLDREKAEKEAAAAANPIEWLVVGLGNPGSKYRKYTPQFRFPRAGRLLQALRTENRPA